MNDKLHIRVDFRKFPYLKQNVDKRGQEFIGARRAVLGRFQRLEDVFTALHDTCQFV